MKSIFHTFAKICEASAIELKKLYPKQDTIIILRVFLKYFKEQLINGKEFKIENLGNISIKKYKPRMNYNYISKKVELITSNKVKIQFSLHYKLREFVRRKLNVSETFRKRENNEKDNH